MKKNIIIVILTIMVIGLFGFIAYDKLLNESKKQENNIEEGNKNEEKTNELENDISWLDYLLEQEFVSASLHVCRIDGKYVYNKDLDWQPNPGTGRNLTKEELKTILNKIYESEINTDPYGEIVKSHGYAAPACADELNYIYIYIKTKNIVFNWLLAQ